MWKPSLSRQVVSNLAQSGPQDEMQQAIQEHAGLFGAFRGNAGMDVAERKAKAKQLFGRLPWTRFRGFALIRTFPLPPGGSQPRASEYSICRWKRDVRSSQSRLIGLGVSWAGDQPVDADDDHQPPRGIGRILAECWVPQREHEFAKQCESFLPFTNSMWRVILRI